MQPKLIPGALISVTATALLLLGWSQAAWGGYCHRCNPCPNGTSGDFYGYYPTNWRPWPQVMISPVQEAIPAPATLAPLPSTSEPKPVPAAKPADKPLE